MCIVILFAFVSGAFIWQAVQGFIMVNIYTTKFPDQQRSYPIYLWLYLIIGLILLYFAFYYAKKYKGQNIL